MNSPLEIREVRLRGLHGGFVPIGELCSKGGMGPEAVEAPFGDA
jgi:hypothetical protein